MASIRKAQGLMADDWGHRCWLSQICLTGVAIKNSDMKSERGVVISEHADGAKAMGRNDASLEAQSASEEHITPEENLFISELGWMAAASVTIASVAAGVGLG